MSASNPYAFPISKYSHILECLQQLNIPATLEELKAPTPQFAMAVLEQFVYLLMGVTREEMRQPKFGTMNLIEYPDLHEESLPEFTLASNIGKLLRAAGVYDTTFRDFMSPDGQRIKIVLSALINFAKFREDNMGIYSQYAAQTDELIENRQQLEAENVMLEKTLAALTAQHEEELPVIQSLEAENAKLTAEIASLHQQQTVLAEEVRKIKASSQEVADKAANTKFQALSARQENEKLRSQIVKSPQKLKKSLTDMSVSTEENRRELGESASKLRDLQSRLDALTIVDEKVQKRVKNMEDLANDMKKCKTLLKDIKDVMARVQENTDKYSELSTSEQHLKKQLQLGKEKIIQMQRTSESRRHRAEVAADQLMAEKQAIMKSQAKDRTRIEQLDAAIQQKRKEIDLITSSHEAETRKLREKCDKLVAQLAAYHQAVLSAMASGNTQEIAPAANEAVF